MASRQLTPTEIADLLRDAIREGVLAPGQQLVQQSLARSVGVSRIPLREALRTLESEGLIELPPGRSGSVVRLSVDELVEIYELRAALESRLAELIISGARLKDIALLRDLQAKMAVERRRDAEQWSRANSRFHMHMYELTGRTRTVHIVEQLMKFLVDAIGFNSNTACSCAIRAGPAPHLTEHAFMQSFQDCNIKHIATPAKCPAICSVYI